VKVEIVCGREAIQATWAACNRINKPPEAHIGRVAPNDGHDRERKPEDHIVKVSMPAQTRELERRDTGFSGVFVLCKRTL
jgi:hypothetical protein